jgi:ubiquilin
MDDMDSMLSNPNFLSQMNEMMNDPAFLQMMEQSPMMRDNPVARALFRDPASRRLLMNPDVIRAQMQAQRALGGQAGAFPAPGVTDTTPEGAAGTSQGTNPQQPRAAAGSLPTFPPANAGGAANANPFASLFGAGANAGGATARGTGDPSNATPATANNPFGNLFGNLPPPEDFRNMLQAFGGMQPPSGGAGGAAGGGQAGATGTNPDAEAQAAAFTRLLSNPDFAQMMGGAGLGGANPGAGGDISSLLGALGGMGAGGAPSQPADTRPPEERYADQLRQLNDMGFFEFDRNVEALRRSGGSVQGAIEHLLGGS